MKRYVSTGLEAGDDSWERSKESNKKVTPSPSMRKIFYPTAREEASYPERNGIRVW